MGYSTGVVTLGLTLDDDQLGTEVEDAGVARDAGVECVFEQPPAQLVTVIVEVVRVVTLLPPWVVVTGQTVVVS